MVRILALNEKIRIFAVRFLFCGTETGHGSVAQLDRATDF